MELVILLPTMDTLRDFHGAPPWMNFLQCYHLIIKSTINLSKNQGSVVARHVELESAENLGSVTSSSKQPSFLTKDA